MPRNQSSNHCSICLKGNGGIVLFDKLIWKNGAAVLSDVKLRTKIRIINIISVVAALVMAAALIISMFAVSSRNEKSMEKTAISVADELLKMELDNAVSIARNIYADSTMYDFFDTEYTSSSKYYEAYYQFQNNNPLTKAELNTIKSYTVYTENPTILTGGIIDTIDSIKRSEWFQKYKKYDKSMLVYCDPETGIISLVRKMDFNRMTHGDCYLKIDINTELLKKACDSLDFDGGIHIFSGGTMIYSNSSEELSEISIDQGYECLTRNYYSADFEYYANVEGYSICSILMDNLPYFIVFLLLVLSVLVLGQLFAHDIAKRTDKCREMFEHEGNLSALAKGDIGADEIGQMADICAELSERLTLRSSEYQQKNEDIRAKDHDYNDLFGTAMRLDAELNVRELFPSLVKESYSEMVPLSAEAEMVRRVGEAHPKAKVFVSEDTNNKKAVPAYCLMLIANNLLGYEGNPSLNLECTGNRVILRYDNDVKPASKRILKLNAIFEDADISQEYSFNHRNVYNPYLRLKHFFGNNAEIEIDAKTGFKLVLTIIVNMEMRND